MTHQTFEIINNPDTPYIADPRCFYCGDYIRPGKFLIQYKGSYFCDGHTIREVLFAIATNTWEEK